MARSSVADVPLFPACPWCGAVQHASGCIPVTADTRHGSVVSGKSVRTCEFCGAAMLIKITIKRVRGERLNATSHAR